MYLAVFLMLEKRIISQMKTKLLRQSNDFELI